MTLLEWCALITLVVLATSMVLGGLFKVGHGIGRRFETVERKLDDNARINQERHEENLQRLTRLETLAVNGGHSRRRRAPA